MNKSLAGLKKDTLKAQRRVSELMHDLENKLKGLTRVGKVKMDRKYRFYRLRIINK